MEVIQVRQKNNSNVSSPGPGAPSGTLVLTFARGLWGHPKNPSGLVFIFVVLLLANILISFTNFSLGGYCRDKGFSDETIGFFYSAGAASSMVAAYISPFWFSIASARAVLSSSLLLCTPLCLYFGMGGDSVPWVFLAYMLYGIGVVFCVIKWAVLLNMWADDGYRGTLFATYKLCLAFGWLISSMLVGYSAYSSRSFLLAGGAFVVIALVTLNGRFYGEHFTTSDEVLEKKSFDVKGLWRVLPLMVIPLMLALSIQVFSTGTKHYVTIWNIQEGFPPSMTAYDLASYSIGSGTVGIFLALLLDRYHHLRISLITAIFMVGAAYGLSLLYLQNVGIDFVVFFTFGAGTTLLTCLMYKIIGDTFKSPQDIGHATAAVNIFDKASTIASSLFFGWWLSSVPLDYFYVPFLFCGFLLLMLFGILLLKNKR